MSKDPPPRDPNSLREKIWKIIFLSDTPMAKFFDVALLVLIADSVLVLMLESVRELHDKHGTFFFVMEWVFTILFTIEYLVRLWTVRRKRNYALSFFGIVDLLSILPSYVALFLGGAQYLVVIRILRLLRLFRIFKMARHMGEANILVNAIRASFPKITVFLLGVFAITVVAGTLIYIIEWLIHGNEQFSNIPESIYWAVVTITTVGFGDITPNSIPGKFLATCMMLLGYGIIAVPTGIMTVEVNRRLAAVKMDKRACNECGLEGHDPKARYCKHCGTGLPVTKKDRRKRSSG